MRCNFFNHIPKLIIFGTHNLHTFKHNTLINELLLMPFYLFPKLHHRKWRKLRVTLPVNMHALFSVCSLRDDNVLTSKPTWKLKHTNCPKHQVSDIIQYTKINSNIHPRTVINHWTHKDNLWPASLIIVGLTCTCCRCGCVVPGGRGTSSGLSCSRCQAASRS